LKKEVDDVKKLLQRLDAFSIIQYFPQKDSPQLYFFHNRVAAENVTINQANYKKRKQQLTNRINSFLNYTNDKKTCRSRMIGTYFGDEKMQQCKICDNCLDHHNVELSPEEFEKIHQEILRIIRPKPFQSKDLLNQLPGVRKEKAWRVVHFLQAENKIEVDKDGMMRLK
jgi:ATP-dependent DNA helicase RecQ